MAIKITVNGELSSTASASDIPLPAARRDHEAWIPRIDRHAVVLGDDNVLDADSAALAIDLELGHRGVIGAASQRGRDATATRDAGLAPFRSFVSRTPRPSTGLRSISLRCVLPVPTNRRATRIAPRSATPF